MQEVSMLEKEAPLHVGPSENPNTILATWEKSIQ